MRAWVVTVGLSLLCVAACDTAAPPPLEPALTGTLPPRASERSCRFDGTPPGVLPELELAPIPLDVTFEHPVAMLPSPDGSGAVLVLERDGRLWRVTEGASAWTGTLLTAAPAHVQAASSLSTSPAHPDHVVVGWRTVGGTTRVSRLTLGAPIDLASEHVILSSSSASTVATTFDDGGLLYAAFADSATLPETSTDAQDPATLEGTVVRVDITSLDATGTYTVPPDNPPQTALGGEGGASAAWAVGLREPAGCAFTKSRAFCLDGGLEVSEVHQVLAARDLGWPDLDGTRCLSPSGCALELERHPQDTVERPAPSCGLVGLSPYLGTNFAPLAGAMIYVDGCRGSVHAMLLEAPDQHLWNGSLLDVPGTPSGVGRDARGEVFVLTRAPAGLWHVTAKGADQSFPIRLSESGCFTNVPSLTPASGLIPYDVNAALWSDGSAKRRFLEVPPGATITVTGGDAPWVFPTGTVLVKTFSYPLDGDTEPTPVEIRVMVARQHGWEFHSYRYDEALGDAVLLDDSDERALAVTTPSGTTSLTHGFPSRFSCTVCHRVDPVDVIAVRTSQLNRIVTYPDGPNRQLAAMRAIGLFGGAGAAALAAPDALVALADPADPKASTEARARAYLHANCAHCHQPGGWVPPNLALDLQYDTPFSSTHTCEVPTTSGEPGVIIAPGDADGSRLFQRMATRDPRKMPPLATDLPDDAALAVVRAWLDGMTRCP